jgi:hypothetical protein
MYGAYFLATVLINSTKICGAIKHQLPPCTVFGFAIGHYNQILMALNLK